MTRHLLTIITIATATASAACATAPEERFYALPAPQPAAAAALPFDRSVVVEPAALPELVDRPQLVVHTDTHQVAVLEQQRWAEPLRAGVSRVVAENLVHLLGTPSVSTREDVLRRPDCRVSLDVRRLDARAGAATTLEALWTVSCAGHERRTGRSLARAPVVGSGYQAIVAAHGRALAVLSADVATALREQR